VRGGQYLDRLERTQPAIPPDSRLAARLAALRSLRHGLTGDVHEAVRYALTARSIEERALLRDEWNAAVPMILLRAYMWLDDYEAVEREVAAAVSMPSLTQPVKLVMVRGAQALAWFQAGHLVRAADAAWAIDGDARRLGFEQHFFALDYLRVLAGSALERRDLDAAEHLAERALSIAERGRPALEFFTLLDRARIWAARGQIHDALATVEAARHVLAGTKSLLLARADELEALLRLSLGDLRSAALLAAGLPPPSGGLLLARIALAAGDHHAALEHLQAPPEGLTPRRVLERQVLLAAEAIERGDPGAASIVGGVLQAARREGFLNTVVTTAPQLTAYLVEHSALGRPEPFVEQLIAAALDVRAVQPEASRPRGMLAGHLTAAELRILKLLPTSTYLQMAATLYVSRNTVKTHLRSIYQKLGVASRPEAIERAVDLRLL
jgi:LuxR family maltose regulon positive regulatory protein